MPRIAGHRRRLPVSETPSTSRPWQQVSEHQRQGMASDVVLDLAWGRPWKEVALWWPERKGLVVPHVEKAAGISFLASQPPLAYW